MKSLPSLHVPKTLPPPSPAQTPSQASHFTVAKSQHSHDLFDRVSDQVGGWHLRKAPCGCSTRWTSRKLVQESGPLAVAVTWIHAVWLHKG